MTGRPIDKMKFKKINIRGARTRFAKGETVYVLPNRMWVYNRWQAPAAIPADENFDNFCNHYRYYNCNSELGNSLAYYVEER